MLKLLSSLEVGETLNISTMSKVPHRSYMTATTRWLYGENRNRTITMIEEEITSSLLSLHKSFSFNLCYDISEAYNGIQNLCITYQTDEESCSRLKKCLEGIETYLQSIGHFNLIELKKNSKRRGIWKKFSTLLTTHPQLIHSEWMKNLVLKIINRTCIAGGTLLVPLLESQEKRSMTLKFLGPIALKSLFFSFYSKSKILNIFLKLIVFSITQM